MTLSSHNRLNAALQVALGDATNNWDMKIIHAKISEISVSKDMENVMTSVNEG